MDIRNLNIGSTFSDEVVDRAIEISEALAQKTDTGFVLDRDCHISHATIYGVQFPAKNVDALIGKLEQVVSELNSAQATFVEPQNPHSGYVDILIDKTPELLHIHDSIITALNPLREGYLPEEWQPEEEPEGLPEGMWALIKKCGYPEAYERWRPHITFSYILDETVVSEMLQTINWDIQETVVSSIGVFESGKYGTCARQLASFNLK